MEGRMVNGGMMKQDSKVRLRGNEAFAACGIASYFALVNFVRVVLEQIWSAGGLSPAAFLEPLLGISFGVWSIVLGFKRDFGGIRPAIVLLGLSALCFLGTLVEGASLFFGFIGFFLLVVSAPRLFLESCKALVSLESSRMAFSAMAGIVGFRLLRAIIGLLPAPVTSVVGIVVAASMLFVSAWRRPLILDAPPAVSSENRTPTFWLMVGLVVMGAVFGIMKGTVSFGGHGLPISLNEIGLGLSAALLLILAVPKKTNDIVVMYRATAFLALAGLCTFVVDGGVHSSFSHAMILTSQQLLLCLVWIVAPLVSFKVGERECRPFGWCFVVFYLNSGVSLLACSLLPIPGVISLLPPLVSLLGIAFFLFMFKENDLKVHLDIHEVKIKSDEEYLEGACAEIASKFSLSNREGEILPYWVRGMQASEIGEVLFVSENTVRSHIHHIYTKTGTHSRRELQKMVES